MMNIGHTSVGLLRLYSSRAIEEASSTPTATGDEATVDPVGDHAGDEHQHRCGEELGQPDPAEVGLAAGDVERFLADGGGLQGDARVQEEVGDEEAADRRVAQHLARAVR